MRMGLLGVCRIGFGTGCRRSSSGTRSGESIARLGRPGAAVQVMDLARPETLDGAKQLVDHYSGDEPAVLREDFYNSLLAAYTVDEVKSQLSSAGLRGIGVTPVRPRGGSSK